MGKVFLVGWKDLKLAFRDRAGLIFMLLAPMLLTLGLGLVTGGFSQTSSTISGIPVVLVNLDSGQVGNALVDTFKKPELSNLLSVTMATDAGSARKLVDDDESAAAVIIPAGFTASIIPSSTTGQAGELQQIEFYSNPTRLTSAGVIKSILGGFLSQVDIGRISAETTVASLLAEGIIQPADAARVGAQVGMQQAMSVSENPAISLVEESTSGEAVKFNILAYMTPGMALLFLMFTVSNGGRALLYEKRTGTLPRLMVAPLTISQILGGKVLGVYLTGVAQMLILILASALFFRLNWGNPLNVLLIVLAAVFGAMGWGSLITSLARTTGQVANIGVAVMLIFGILGGSFFNVESLPSWFVTISRITPNSWGISAFNTLASGGALVDILPALLALLIMGALLFGVAVIIIRRRGLFQN